MLFLCTGVTGEGEEDVIEVGSVNRQCVDRDRFLFEPVEHGLQRSDAAISWNLKREIAVVARYRPQTAGPI